ncbi:MAG: hypothetical protein JST38_15995 [Bacteroidetes bacterium]|nr:hypothetical protein [Bacteroidota bacterium]
MANSIQLELYTIATREKRATEFVPLEHLGENHGFLDFFKGFITSLDKDMLDDEEQKRSLQVTRSRITSNVRMISGIFESGEYGLESRIVNRKTRKQTYKKSVDDVDIKPFYFLLYIPEKSGKGLLVLQRTGGFGINTVVRKHLNRFFGERFGGLKMEVNQYLSKDLAEKFIGGGAIQEISIRKYDLPQDLIDKLGLTSSTSDILSVELRITARQKGMLRLNNKVKKFVKNPNANFFDIPEVKKLGFDGGEDQKTTIKARHGNRTRTIDLGDTMQIRPYYDIDSEVEKDAGGHPIFKSIDDIARALAKESILTE